MRFPSVSGKNLNRRRISAPDGLAGELNIVLIAFQQWHQRHVDTWIPFVRELEDRYPGVAHYEFPVIRSMNVLARTFINEGMRAGIPDPIARERTITLYLDKPAFRESMGVTDEDDITVALIDRDGALLWRSYGKMTPESAAALQEAVAAAPLETA